MCALPTPSAYTQAKPVAAIFTITPTQSISDTTHHAHRYSELVRDKSFWGGTSAQRRTSHCLWTMVWVPIVPPRPQPLK